MSMPPAAGPPDDDPISDLVRLRASTYPGRDPDNLVTAVVDSDGTVVSIRFAATIALHSLATTEEAVLVAIANAQRRMTNAWRDQAARIDPNSAGAPDAPYGGLADQEVGGTSEGARLRSGPTTTPTRRTTERGR